MKHHSKQYEDVFSTDKPKSTTPLNEHKISAIGMDLNEYTSLFHDFLKEDYANLFLSCVKLSWLRRKFTYNGTKIKLPIYNNSRFLQNSFTKFLRRYVGNDIQILTKGKFFPKLESSYFDILFPGFEEGNPFENPDYYKFPYENISMEFLTVVDQLDDRFELLKVANEKKMSYATFLDYILNFILSENEILGKSRYVMTQNDDRHAPYYVKDTQKVLKPKKGMKRT